MLKKKKKEVKLDTYIKKNKITTMNLWLQIYEELNGINIYYFLTHDPPKK